MVMLMGVPKQQVRVAAGRSVIAGAVFCVLAALSTSASCALAQGVAATPLLAPPSPKASSGNALVKNAGTLKIASRPAWQDLTTSQQLSLQPLAPKWSTLSETQKRKWIAIAVNYPRLTAAEQTKLHSHMTEWVALSQQQRSQARLNFAESKQIPPTQKAANWEAYQALDPDEKKKLANSATPRPVGAATAAKLVVSKRAAVHHADRAARRAVCNSRGAFHVAGGRPLGQRLVPDHHRRVACGAVRRLSQTRGAARSRHGAVFTTLDKATQLT